MAGKSFVKKHFFVTKTTDIQSIRISLHMTKLMDLQRKFRAAGFSENGEQLE